MLTPTPRADLVFKPCELGVPLRSTPGRGPRPSISAGVRDFMLSPAPQASILAKTPAGGHPLEPEPRLQFNYAPGKAAQGTSEVRVSNDRAGVEKADRRQVDHVENVEEIRA